MCVSSTTRFISKTTMVLPRGYRAPTQGRLADWRGHGRRPLHPGSSSCRRRLGKPDSESDDRVTARRHAMRGQIIFDGPDPATDRDWPLPGSGGGGEPFCLGRTLLQLRVGSRR